MSYNKLLWKIFYYENVSGIWITWKSFDRESFERLRTWSLKKIESEKFFNLEPIK